MPQLALKGGFYQSRSLIANAQRCLNLYPERNSEDSPFPYTMYLTPGLTVLREADAVDGPLSGVARGGYTASNGDGFCVVGQTLYFVDADWRFVTLGVLTEVRTTPVSMYDNGITLMIVDGSSIGYEVDLATYAFAAIADADFLGADRVDYIDTFLVSNVPGTRQWQASDSNALAWEALSIASKTGLPDPLQTLICMHREVWLLGTNRSTEVWYNAGGSPFPFAISPGIFIEQGCLAKYSLCKHDLMIFFLGRDKDGLATVFMGQPGGKITRISTPAIAALLLQYTGTELSAAIGMTYKQQDHIFYLLSLTDITLVYDVSEGLWHERCYLNAGEEEPIRPNWITLMNDVVVGGDRETGTLYRIDPDAYSDNGDPIPRVRSFPHLLTESGDGASYPLFRTDMQVGDADVSFDTVPIFLRVSLNGGRTFGEALVKSMGLTGEYFTSVEWRQLGLGRDVVFELSWSEAVNTALNGGWISKPHVQATS